ncbi:MAG TPA: hypothetical protein VF460_00880 [Burkholderiales bacterium]
MKKLILIGMALALTACAHMSRPSPDQEFEAYRSEVRQQRDAGTITAVQEQEKLRDQYWALYGRDGDSAAHFAFTVALMRSVEAGDFPAKDADALIAAREKEIFALKMASRQLASSYEYPEN